MARKRGEAQQMRQETLQNAARRVPRQIQPRCAVGVLLWVIQERPLQTTPGIAHGFSTAAYERYEPKTVKTSETGVSAGAGRALLRPNQSTMAN